MVEKTIVLHNICDVNDFVNITSNFSGDVQLINGRYLVDAKSIMDIFTLDLSRPVAMKADCEENCEFMCKIDKYIVK